jgi:cyclophilin family peptidyl-prolyl cis-trans isomerase
MQFHRSWSPYGVDRLYQLILDHYFDCAVFFRVVPGTYIYI